MWTYSCGFHCTYQTIYVPKLSLHCLYICTMIMIYMKIIYGCLSKSTLQIRKPMTIYRFMISLTVLQNLLPVFAWRQVIIGYLVKTKCAGSFLYIQIFQQFQLHVSVTLLSMIILLRNTCGKQINVSLFLWVLKFLSCLFW